MGSLGDEDLLLDVELPGVGLLDDLQLDCGLDGCQLPPGLDDGLGLGVSGGAAGAHPAASDLLESLQLDAFALPGSCGSHGSPSGSGTDSPVALLPPANLAALAAAPGPSQRPRRSGGASPATSESENRGAGAARGRSGSPASAATAQRAGGGVAAPSAGGQQYATEDEKRLARMQRNRENAQLSRQRKKQQMEDLQGRCNTLVQQNAQLVAAVQRLTAENATLRQQLALVCQAQKGVAAAAGAAAKPPAAAAAAAAKPVAAAAKPAAVPTPAKPASVAAAAAAGAKMGQALTVQATAGGAATAAAAAVVAARGLQWPLLPFAGLLPKVTLPVMQRPAAQQQQQRPAAQPAAVARPAPAAAAERAPKRARTAAGASTAFLALFTLFMFSGLTPVPLTTPTSTSGSSSALAAAGGAQRTLQALPDPSALANGIRHSGRGLQALPAAGSDVGGGQLVQHGPQPFVGPATSPLGDPGGSSSVPRGPHLQQLLNSTLQALLLEPDNAALEAAALQRLQELGPVALLLDSDDARGGPGANPLAASAAFPQLAGQLFGGAGLEVPQMCQPVLEFDASSVPHAARTRRNLERHVMGATGFRGRSLAAASGAAAGGPAGAAAVGGRPGGGGTAGAPALRISEEDGEGLEGPEQGSEGSDALLPASSAAGPVLVSILLPANASGNGSGSSGKLAAADKVFVVLLHPQERFVTYSCSLPRPVVL